MTASTDTLKMIDITSSQAQRSDVSFNLPLHHGAPLAPPFELVVLVPFSLKALRVSGSSGHGCQHPSRRTPWKENTRRFKRSSLGPISQLSNFHY
jgi:hypothetical protein